MQGAPPAGNERAIRSIAVLGGGLVGLSAALAFARALPRVAVTIVDTPADPAALADRLPGALPTIHRFHAAIGVDEIDLIRLGITFHHLGTRFEHWSASGEPWYHVFGEHGLPAGPAPFHHIWVRARHSGEALPFHEHSAAAVLAQAGKFAHPSPDPDSPLAGHLYGLRFNPGRYCEHLRTLARALPIRWTEGRFKAAERREDGGIAALVLESGERIEADLFVDCGGPSAPLMTAVGGGFEDWSESLPGDRLILALDSDDTAPVPFDTASAEPLGWRMEQSVPGGLVRAFAFASGAGEDEARRAFGREAEPVAVRAGRQRAPWIRNVLALGDAAVAVGVLENAGLHLAHNAILRALDLLPGRDCHPLELGEYVRRTSQETERVRDFIALHFLRSGRSEGPFWQTVAEAALPASLARTLDQFETRGRLPFFEEETFSTDSWLAVLFGVGILPRHVDPVAAAIDPAEAAAGMKRFADRVAKLPAGLPSYPDYLARMRRGGTG
jgi:tryptophan halogenase